MRIVLQFLIPFGLFVAVLLTPFYLQRDSRKNEGELIFDEQSTTNDGLFGTITYTRAVSTPRSFSSSASTTAASTTTTAVVTTRTTAKKIMTTNVSPKITTTTTTTLITTTNTNPISATTTTTTATSTTITTTITTTTSTSTTTTRVVCGNLGLTVPGYENCNLRLKSYFDSEGKIDYKDEKSQVTLFITWDCQSQVTAYNLQL